MYHRVCRSALVIGLIDILDNSMSSFFLGQILLYGCVDCAVIK